MKFPSLLLAAISLVSASCSVSRPVDNQAADFSGAWKTPSYWAGRWNDGTGYWLDIVPKHGSFALKRSGDPSTLTFIGFTRDQRKFHYREDDRYLHTLTAISPNRVGDRWLTLPRKKVWRDDFLYKEPMRAASGK